MTPGASSVAHRSDPRPLRRRAPAESADPPLRIVDRRSRRPRIQRLVRPELWVGGTLVVGSLLAIVVGDAVVAQGQIRLTQTQQAITAATATEKGEQVAVAGMAAPPVVVRAAESLGLVAPTSIVDLPSVPLDVPLPVPDTTANGSSSQ